MDVAYSQLNYWTCLQRTRVFSATKGGDVLFPSDFWEDLLILLTTRIQTCYSFCLCNITRSRSFRREVDSIWLWRFYWWLRRHNWLWAFPWGLVANVRCRGWRGNRSINITHNDADANSASASWYVSRGGRHWLDAQNNVAWMSTVWLRRQTCWQ